MVTPYGNAPEALLRDGFGRLRSSAGGAPDFAAEPAADEGTSQPLDLADLTEFVPKAKLRRIDPYSRSALSAAAKALAHANLWEKRPESMGIITATGYGPVYQTFKFLDSILDDGPELASPTAFSYSVHTAPTALISMLFSVHGPMLTVSHFATSFTSALATACAWLQEGRVEHVLLGCVEESDPVLERFTGPASAAAAFYVLGRTAGPGGLRIQTIDQGRFGEGFSLPEIPRLYLNRFPDSPEVQAVCRTRPTTIFIPNPDLSALPTAASLTPAACAAGFTSFFPNDPSHTEALCLEFGAQGNYGMVEFRAGD